MLRSPRCHPSAAPLRTVVNLHTGAHLADRGPRTASSMTRSFATLKRTSPRTAIRPHALLYGGNATPPALSRPTAFLSAGQDLHSQPHTTPARTDRSASARPSRGSLGSFLAKLTFGMGRVEDFISEHKVLRAKLSVERQMHMLASAHADPVWQDPTFVHRAAARYVKWLKLKSRYRNAQLHLPFDIEVVMHAHHLHPRLYAQCCDRHFGETLGLLQEAELTPDDQQLRMTQTLWHQAYGTDLSPDVDSGDITRHEATSLWTTIGKNIANSIKKQASAHPAYAKSGLVATDGTTAEELVKRLAWEQMRYEKFFLLMAKHPSVTLVPTRGIDLFWHEHMRDPVAYQEACDRLLDGKLINHNDEIEPIALSDCLATTSRLWAEAYEEDYLTGEAKRRDSSTCGGCGSLGSCASKTSTTADAAADVSASGDSDGSDGGSSCGSCGGGCGS